MICNDICVVISSKETFQGTDYRAGRGGAASLTFPKYHPKGYMRDSNKNQLVDQNWKDLYKKCKKSLK